MFCGIHLRAIHNSRNSSTLLMEKSASKMKIPYEATIEIQIFYNFDLKEVLISLENITHSFY